MLRSECNEKINFFTLVGCSTILSACAVSRHAVVPLVEIVPVSPASPIINSIEALEIEEESVDKVLSDGCHLLNLPMTRDFILESQKNLKLEKGGDPKINAIKPMGDTKPRAVILFNNRLTWTNILVREKNMELCKGFINLPKVIDVEEQGRQINNDKEKDRKNHVITYMPTTVRNINTLPKTSNDCGAFLTAGYDYRSAENELNFILSQQNINRGKGDNSASGLEISRRQNNSPYIVVYESPQRPYSSMILGFGSASLESIAISAKNWPELLAKVYQTGDPLDPIVAVVTMLNHDPALKEEEKDAMWKNITIVATGVACGGALTAGTPISLATLLATPACKIAYDDAKKRLGY